MPVQNRRVNYGARWEKDSHLAAFFVFCPGHRLKNIGSELITEYAFFNLW